MDERGQFVQRPGRTRNIAALVLAAAAFGMVHAADAALTPRSSAREYAPGELVRFAVAAGPDVAAITGEFLGKPVSFAAARRDAAGSEWVGWGVIPLDAKAGAALLTVSSADAPAATSTIAIVDKAFPEQRLTVESKFVNPPKAAQQRIERERKKLDAVYAKRTPMTPPSTVFVRPVPGEPTSEFGLRRIFNGEPRSPHPGIDLRAATGTPVLAAGPGKVVLAESLYYAGGTVIVDHGGGLFTIYAHLSKIETKAGATVEPGKRVGLSGATGRVTGPHLHWGARVGGEIFDPRALLDARLFE